jgi:hypothetical protein
MLNCRISKQCFNLLLVNENNFAHTRNNVCFKPYFPFKITFLVLEPCYSHRMLLGVTLSIILHLSLSVFVLCVSPSKHELIVLSNGRALCCL